MWIDNATCRNCGKNFYRTGDCSFGHELKEKFTKRKKKQLWRGLKKKNDENPLRLCPIQQKGITLMNNCEKGKARRQGHL